MSSLLATQMDYRVVILFLFLQTYAPYSADAHPNYKEFAAQFNRVNGSSDNKLHSSTLEQLVPFSPSFHPSPASSVSTRNTSISLPTYLIAFLSYSSVSTSMSTRRTLSIPSLIPLFRGTTPTSFHTSQSPTTPSTCFLFSSPAARGWAKCSSSSTLISRSVPCHPFSPTPAGTWRRIHTSRTT